MIFFLAIIMSIVTCKTILASGFSAKAHTSKGKPYRAKHFFKDTYVVPGPRGMEMWNSSRSFAEGKHIIDMRGNMWEVTSGGFLGESVPSMYDHEVKCPKGNAWVRFMGRSVFQDVWKTSVQGGVCWYFSFLAAGLEAKRIGQVHLSKRKKEDKARLSEIKLMLTKAIKMMCGNWYPYCNYKQGMILNEDGYLWECLETGDSGFNKPSFATFVSNYEAQVATDSRDAAIIEDGNITWRLVGRHNSTAKYFWVDWEPDMQTTHHEDSHDSYASMFLWAVQQYIAASRDYSWLSKDVETSTKNTYGAGADDFKLWSILKEIAYYNLCNNIGFPDNFLTNTFQAHLSPEWEKDCKGDKLYPINYLMDNCESYIGLMAMQEMTTNPVYGPQVSSQDYGQFASGILASIHDMRISSQAAYKYFWGNEEPPVGHVSFYPWIMCNLSILFWSIPIPAKGIPALQCWLNGLLLENLSSDEWDTTSLLYTSLAFLEHEGYDTFNEHPICQKVVHGINPYNKMSVQDYAMWSLFNHYRMSCGN